MIRRTPGSTRPETLFPATTVCRSSAGATEDEKKLAFFRPGILVSLGYTIVLGGSCLARWPALGFMLGAATEDPVGWHDNKQVVRLCSRLTWVMLLDRKSTRLNSSH